MFRKLKTESNIIIHTLKIYDSNDKIFKRTSNNCGKFGSYFFFEFIGYAYFILSLFLTMV